MSDYTELKRMAEACGNLNWRFQQENWTEYAIRDDHGYIAVMRVKSAKHSGPDPDREAKAVFLGAATPATVLALIAENEALSIKHAEAGRLYLELAAERDQLQAENELLRKDAERYRFVSQLAWYVDKAAWVYDIGKARSPWADDLEAVDADDVEAAIDAAMVKGDQP